MSGRPCSPPCWPRCAERIVVADGAMGTMLQAADLTLDDFDGLEGCNEILNVTRPDVVRGVHDAYLAAGADAVETNTFGANLANLGEYGIATGSASCPRPAPGSPGRPPTRWPPRTARGCARLGRPGHQAAHPRPRPVRDAARRVPGGGRRPDRRRRRRGARRDLPGPAAGQGRRSSAPSGRWPRPGRPVPLICQVAVETTGTMLLGSRDRRGADRAGAARRRPDRAELLDRPGRDERAPALPVPARPGAAVGDAERGPAGAGRRTARTTR